MKENKKTIILTIMVFISLIGLVTIMNSDLTFAVEEGVYYADDLKIGDIIPNGAKIIANIDYHDASGRYADYVYLRYIPAKEDTKNYFESRNYSDFRVDYLSTCYIGNYTYSYEPGFTTDEACEEKYGESSYQDYSDFNSFTICNSGNAFHTGTLKNYTCDLEKIQSNEQYTVLDYETYFKDSNLKFTGWQVVNLDANMIYLEPINDSNKINQTPSSTNDWTIDTTLGNKNGSTNKWYKYTVIDDYEFYQSNQNIENIWKYENGIYSIMDNNTGNANDEYSVTFTFDAKKDDIVYFDLKYYGYRSGYGENYYPNDTHCVHEYCGDYYKMYTSFYLDDISLDEIPQTDFYKTNYLKITSTGTHTLKISYNVPVSYNNQKYGYLNYIYLKELMVLTPLNYEKILNEDLVQEGDNLFYESLDNNGVKLSQRVVYDKKAEPTEDKDDSENENNNSNSPEDNKDNNFVNPETLSNVLIVFLISGIVGGTTFITYKSTKKEPQKKSTKKKISKTKKK